MASFARFFRVSLCGNTLLYKRKLWASHWARQHTPWRSTLTKTFIYGSYDGAIIFAEPMVTKAYLETTPTAIVTPIKLPAQYAAVGYQATSYTSPTTPARRSNG